MTPLFDRLQLSTGGHDMQVRMGFAGMHVAAPAAQHGFDVESDLAATLPAEDKQEDPRQNGG